jgi:tetratricopeptide (TPR) repeat protein
MKLITCSAIALAAALAAASPAIAQYGSSYGASAPPPPPQVPQTPVITQQQPQSATPSLKISKEALKAIADLQKTVLANDFANVPAKVQAALAVAKTNEDRYAIAQLQLKAAVTAKDDNASLAAINAMAATNFLPANQMAELYSSVGVNFYNAKRFDDSAAAFEKAASLAPNDPKPYEYLSDVRLSQGRTADATAALQRAMQLNQAAGRKPDETLLKRAISLAYDAKSPSAITLGKQWVAAYPSPTSWRNALAIYRNMSHPDVEGTLDVLRLIDATGALSQPADYELYATSAADQGNFVEGLAVLNRGIAAKHIDAATPKFRDILAGLKAKPQATEADLAEAAKTAPAGSTLIRIGDRYYALGNYAKAAETDRAALAKPGTDKDMANLHLGMALARAGDKAGAAAAVNQVGGPLTEIAKFWLIYVQGA